MKLIVETPAGCIVERRYVLDVLLTEFLGLTYEHHVTGRADVALRMEGDGRRELRTSDAFFRDATASWLAPDTLPKTPIQWLDVPEPLNRRLDEPVPVLFGDVGDAKPLAHVVADNVTLNVDVCGTAFFMLSRYEEMATQLSEPTHEWFPADASLAVREGFVHRPIVNEYLELLWNALHLLWPELHRSPRQYRALLSHDVDWPSCNVGRGLSGLLRTSAGDVLARKSLPLLARRLASGPEVLAGRRDRDVCNTFGFIMDASESRGLRSAFYFIAGHTAGVIDGIYDVGDPWIRRLLVTIHRRGHEIGIHPSYETFLSASQTEVESRRLREICHEEGIAQPEWGGRQHYLRWRVGATWSNWEQATLAYDSTVGFAERLGFRCGVCYEFPVFDLGARRALALRERPLVAMEVSALDIMKLTLSETATEMVSLSETCRKYDGDFTMLWHNNRLVTTAERRTYLRILDAVAAKSIAASNV